MVYVMKKKGKIDRRILTVSSITATVLTLMIAMSLNEPISASPATVEITAKKHAGITIDGMIGDWTGVSGTTITLIRPYATTDRIENGLEIRVAYDDSNVYVLVLINDDYDYNSTDHHKSGAIAVLFAIDEAATPDMGGDKGYVDIWHWELDVGPGVVAGFNLTSGNDPVGNLDDEYAKSITNRHDDTLANEVYGAWSHTNTSAVGAKGKWIFEFKRPLTTSDTLKQDIQFEIGKTYKMAVAYWDADEKGEPGVNNGWTGSGHYSTCTDPETLDFSSWIEVTFEAPTPTTSADEALSAAQQATTLAYIAIALAVVMAGVAIGISYRKK